MNIVNSPTTAEIHDHAGKDPVSTTDSRLNEVADLLSKLNVPPVLSPQAPLPTPEQAHENHLAMVRLGIASSLFGALRAKHPATASHCMRVAMGVSSWSLLMDLKPQQRDEIEVAALLHDLGKIGVPDRILLKPDQLSEEEFSYVDQHRSIGVDILRGCCDSESLLAMVQHCNDWYDGSRRGQTCSGNDLPLGSRMIAIVDAFDAITNDQVYRHALSREHAMSELFQNAGRQFDPELVSDFCTFMNADQIKLHTVVAYRWLKQLHAEQSNDRWRLCSRPVAEAESTGDVFQHKLLEAMHDAVVFIDNTMRITLWNRAAERLTGISAESLHYRHWSPALIHLRDENQKLFSTSECPLTTSMQRQEQTVRRLSMISRGGSRTDIDCHIIPVFGTGGVPLGAAMMMHDIATQVTLEQRVQSLHEQATRDALTQVANRAEFDRTLSTRVSQCVQKRLPLSLIICDIDHFKKVNDTFGHQAGDAVLIAFGSLLKRHGLSGDLIARYGGEEFVILCGDCNNATATRRAEKIRAELEAIQQPALNGKCLTASFGVTELQDGDTPETMLRRADRGLYQAKANGRNMVVQLGAGIRSDSATPERRGWFSWFRSEPIEDLVQRTLVTAVPLNIVGEKLRGFVADHSADIKSLDENHILLEVIASASLIGRRDSDRPTPFCMDLRLEESSGNDAKSRRFSRTLIHVSIRPVRGRDRRQQNMLDMARRLLGSLKSYLIAQEIETPSQTATTVPAGH